jgi:tRNA-dihydrouridine synthase B
LIAEYTPSLKIGTLQLSNPLLLAPLSGISDLPFRLLAKEQGCALVCTEMVSAEGLVQTASRVKNSYAAFPEERPLPCRFSDLAPKLWPTERK